MRFRKHVEGDKKLDAFSRVHLAHRGPWLHGSPRSEKKERGESRSAGWTRAGPQALLVGRLIILSLPSPRMNLLVPPLSWRLRASNRTDCVGFSARRSSTCSIT